MLVVTGKGLHKEEAGVLRSAPWIPVAAGFVASALGVGFYVVLGQLVGQQFRLPELPQIIVVTAVINALLVFPAVFALRWVERAGPDRMMAAR